MPGFVKTPKDEARWAKAKEAASKETDKGSEGYWKLSNYIFHKMGKTEEDQKIAEVLKKSLSKPSMGGLKQTALTPVPGVVSPMQASVGTAVKTPKAKKMGQATDKPSVFFGKSEEFKNIKKSSIENLRTFLEKQRNKR